ncbi:MAG: hypothetical protein V3U76_06275 [Granulosicoccus sp.]
MRADPVQRWRFNACKLFVSVGVSLLLMVPPDEAYAEVNSSVSNDEALVSVQIEQPSRAFGYVLGDVLIQRVQLPANTDSDLLLDSLPANERTGQWLERQAATIQSDKKHRPWLYLRYQIVNSPEELTTATLPALKLLVNEDGESDTEATLQVDTWSFTLGPITPEVVAETGDLLALRPDRQPEAIDITGPGLRIRYTTMALAALALGWLIWWLWRQRRDATRLPFAIAWQTIKKTGRQKADEQPNAWMALHHAFNDAAGQTVHAGSVGDLMTRQPWLQALSDRIELFYAASAARFFEQPARAQPFELHDFSRLLYQAEKRHAE